MKLTWDFTYKYIFWIRINKNALVFKNTKKHKLSFSQRNGYQKFYRIGKNWIWYITKD